MLNSLQIENIAIIESASAEFSSGLNILTGETGAGKSILIDSINAVTGEKTSRELIRTGESSACVTALFSDVGAFVTNKLIENGITANENGELLLQRRIYKDGKNACRINGMSVTVSMLKSIGMSLINIHGQRDSQELLDPDKHMNFVDSYAKNSDLYEEYRSCFFRLQSVKSQINALKTDAAAKARKIDLLNYQIAEIERANITVGETAALNKRKAVLVNSVKLGQALNAALSALCGMNEGEGASSLISSAVGSINSVLHISNSLMPVASSLLSAAETVDDAASVIDDVLRQLESLDDSLEEIEERLDVLYRLSKKYGDTEEEMLEFLSNAKAELDDIVNSDELLAALEAERETVYADACKKAEALSLSRKKAGEKLAQKIVGELNFLDMPDVRFVTEHISVPLCETGADNMQFLISANPGEQPKPLSRIASGGELSRVMLAMKNVLVSDESVGTLIFDEVDAGVSGSAAGKIAVKLACVSLNTQVLCITHLAQIAAYGDEHKFLYKEVIDNKTYTRIRSLNRSERAQELARITFGGVADKNQLLSAEKMISNADTEKAALAGR